MAIDPNSEQLLTFQELALSLPRRRKDRPVHVSTIHRWRTRGLAGGIRLEALKVGGCWCTTREAFERFCRQLTAAENSAPSPPSPNPEKSAKADAILNASNW